MSAEGTMAGSSPLLLLVDDYADNREMYAQYLSFMGFRVAEAANGLQALEQAFALVPDLIVMDLSLPGMDGWEATRALKTDPRTRAIPVLALTGNALAGYSQRALAAGCAAFVTKPCLPQELEQHVRGLLAKGRAAPPAPPVDPPAPRRKRRGGESKHGG